VLIVASGYQAEGKGVRPAGTCAIRASAAAGTGRKGGGPCGRRGGPADASGKDDQRLIARHTLQDQLRGSGGRQHLGGCVGEFFPRHVGGQGHVDHAGVVVNVGPREPGADAADLYPQVGAFQAQRQGEPHDGVLGRAIGGVAWGWEERGRRGDVHNVAEPLPGHDRVGGQNAVQHAVEVHIQDLAPVVKRQVTGITAEPDAGVAEQVVPAAVTGGGVLDQVPDVLLA
jgi:hypothetical protein